MKLFDLTGRAALVTGGNGGIILGMARGLAQAGAGVMIVGRDRQKSAEAVRELTSLGVKAASAAADLADETACQSVVMETVAKFGRLDILVNNAGIGITKRPEELSPADWRQTLDINLTSAFALSQAAYPELKRAGRGKIINIGSMMSLFGAPFAAAYAASKGGLVQLTKALATAWAAENIQVNAVLPGWIDTSLTRMARQHGRPERSGACAHAGRPLGRARGPRRHRRFPRERRVGLHHRCRHPGRRRILSAGIAATARLIAYARQDGLGLKVQAGRLVITAGRTSDADLLGELREHENSVIQTLAAEPKGFGC